MTIQVEIVTPSRQLYSGEVEMITLPGVEGEMGVLAGHAPLLTTLNIGELTLHNADGEPDYIAVSGGVVEVLPDKVIVMARSAERADEIDIARARRSPPTRRRGPAHPVARRATARRSRLPPQPAATQGRPPSPPHPPGCLRGGRRLAPLGKRINRPGLRYRRPGFFSLSASGRSRNWI